MIDNSRILFHYLRVSSFFVGKFEARDKIIKIWLRNLSSFWKTLQVIENPKSCVLT